MSFDGIVLIDKPAGWSSFDVVAKIRGKLRREQAVLRAENSPTSENGTPTSALPKVKVGHTGTLDPLATGLMIVVVGSYCKRAGEFSKLDKVYEVEMKLGETSTTGDEEGLKTKVESREFTEGEVGEVLESFIGESLQTPPKHSAVKIGGKRAYQLAREGKEVVIEPRKITIYEIQLASYDYPFVRFTVHVSSGTYIRSLVEDIGKHLGTGAYMTQLRRTKVGQFDITNACEIADVSRSALRTAG